MTDAIDRTLWVDAVRRGEQPDAAALIDHLLTVHASHAGFTEACAKRCRDAKGRNSYEWLADAVPHTARRVLDLACGSGPLLELIHGRSKSRPTADRPVLTGVDMSRDELALAAGRLPLGAATLINTMAQELPMVADAAIDAVLCHWALTLMDPVTPVLEEVSRLLAPGGTFAAIIDGDMAAAPSYGAVNDIIFTHVQAALPAYGTIEMGDPRVRRGADLADLAREVFAGDSVAVATSVFSLTGPPDVLAVEASGFFYAAFVLTPQARCEMLEDLAAHFAREADPRFDMPVNRLMVQRSR